MRKKAFEELNDGNMFVGEKQTLRDDKRKKIGSEFKIVQRLRFKYKHIRERDFNFYGSWDSKLDIKVLTYRTTEPGENTIVKIGKSYYDVIRTDYDLTGRHMYWYLSKRSDGDWLS